MQSELEALRKQAASLHKQADHAAWLGGVALFEAERSEDDHHCRAEARAHHAEAQRLRELAWDTEKRIERFGL